MEDNVGWKSLGPVEGTASNPAPLRTLSAYDYPPGVLANIIKHLPLDQIQRVAPLLTPRGSRDTSTTNSLISYLGAQGAPIARYALKPANQTENRLDPQALKKYFRLMATVHDQESTSGRMRAVKVDLRNPQYFHEVASQALLIRKQRGSLPEPLAKRLVEAWPPVGDSEEVKIGTRQLSRAVKANPKIKQQLLARKSAYRHIAQSRQTYSEVLTMALQPEISPAEREALIHHVEADDEIFHVFGVAEEEQRTLLAESGTPQANYLLAKMHYKGLGGPKNVEMARRLLADLDFDDAKMYLASTHLDEHSESHYAIAERLLGEVHSSQAKFWLGVMHFNGQAAHHNFQKARNFFRESGLPDAKCYLGRMYQAGLGGEINYQVAKELFITSGTKTAKLILGLMYRNGQGTPVRFIEARRLLSESGTSQAKYVLGLMNLAGEGAPADFVAARRLFDESHSASAKTALAKMHLKGQGGPINYAEAKRLFLFADTPEAKYQLGKMALTGKGGQVNQAEAAELFDASGTFKARLSRETMKVSVPLLRGTKKIRKFMRI